MGETFAQSEANLKTLRQLLPMVEYETSLLQAHHNQTLNSKACAVALPIEILTSIFELVCAVEVKARCRKDGWDRGAQTRRTHRSHILAVCKHWRKVALGFCALWSDVVLEEPCSRNPAWVPNIRLVHLELTRSLDRGVPISVSLMFHTGDFLEQAKEILEAIASSQIIHVVTNPETVDAANKTLQLLSRSGIHIKRSLYLSMTACFYRSDIPPITLDLRTATQLTMLHISQKEKTALARNRLVYVLPSPCNIQRLHLSGDLDPSSFFEAFRTCSQTLKILVFEGFFTTYAGSVGYANPQDIPPLPALECLSLVASTHTPSLLNRFSIAAPNVTRLRIAAPHCLSSTPPAWSFGDPTMFPRLCTFEMYQDGRQLTVYINKDMTVTYPDCDKLLNFMSSHSELEDMVVCCPIRGETDTQKWEATRTSFSHPSLRVLAVRNMSNTTPERIVNHPESLVDILTMGRSKASRPLKVHYQCEMAISAHLKDLQENRALEINLSPRPYDSGGIWSWPHGE